MRQERARAMHHAPEIDVHQPVHLRLIDLAKLAHQGDAGIVDEDVETGMASDGGRREFRDLRRLADIDAMHGDLLLMAALDLRGDARRPASSRSASARSQPRDASSRASARPIPLAAPVKAAAAPRMAVISMSLPWGEDACQGRSVKVVRRRVREK